MSDTFIIKCNNVPRHTLDWNQLTDKEKKEFDYLDTDEKQLDARFARYKGWTYDLGEFQFISPEITHPKCPEWNKFHGYRGESFFSGVLVRFDGERGRYSYDTDKVVMATYFC